MDSAIKRVGIVFAGGPAPAANAVISAAVISFLDSGREVVGFFHGYSNLQDYDPESKPLLPDKHYRIFDEKDVRGIRNERGILIGTARSNPGKQIEKLADVTNKEKNAPLGRTYQALVDLKIDALISIGGDDTLKTANLLHLFQEGLGENKKRIPIVHLPKTIDNDYKGIDFTFGFFTAVDVMAKELQNLRADAVATSGWFVVETMGRKAGWLSYGVAIAGEANLVLAPEDISDSLCKFEGKKQRLCVEKLSNKILDLILSQEEQGKPYGTVVLAEGLAEMLPDGELANLPLDEHGHIPLSQLDLGKFVAERVKQKYKAKTGQTKKIVGIQLGYESRCSPPHAFDVMLGSQLGIGAYRALIEEKLSAHMVSVSGQLDLHYVPFTDLINPDTLRTEVRLMVPGSDFHRLARFLETRVDTIADWSTGRRYESDAE